LLAQLLTDETGITMAIWKQSDRRTAVSRVSCIAAATASAILLGACANGGGSPLALLNQEPESEQSEQKVADAKAPPQTELEKATEYWGKMYKKDQSDAQPAINYARNLKALGQKEQALNVLQAAHQYHPSNRQLNSEYGRLSLEMDQYGAAQKLLEQADDPTRPDWKTISARGTVLAKQGKYNEAIPHFERALAVSPGQPSVLNNLALARAMNGQADKAEALLRQAAAADDNADNPKISQNLSLVLGLQGKYDEAKSTGQKALSQDSAAEDVNYMRQIVKLEQRSAIPPQTVATALTQSTDAGQKANTKIATSSTIKSGGKKPALTGMEAVAALAEADAASQTVRAQGGPSKINDAYRPPAQ
jgi:Flp pilus assembly protein TadD